MKRLALMAGILALLATAPAMAQVGSDWDSTAESYNAQERAPMESDGSGETMARPFADTDADGDGFVSEQEYGAVQDDAATQERGFQDMDADGDGQLSEQEYGAAQDSEVDGAMELYPDDSGSLQDGEAEAGQ